MSDYGRRATPTGNFNGWINNLLSALYSGETFANSYNQYTSILRDFRNSSLDRINASVKPIELLDEYALNIAGRICEMENNSSTTITDMLKETVSLFPKLKKFRISGPKIDGYISLLNQGNKIYKGRIWYTFADAVSNTTNNLKLIMELSQENSEFISMKSLDAIISLCKYIAYERTGYQCEKYFDIIQTTLTMFIEMLKKDNSPAIKTSNNSYLKSSLKNVMYICSKSNSIFDDFVYPTLQELAIENFKSEKLEKAKFGIVLLTALFNSLKVDSLDPNEVFNILLDKDIHNSVVAEITPLFSTFAENNLITSEHLEKIWERCLSVHTSQKETYLSILGNTLHKLPTDQQRDFFQAKMTNVVKEPLILTLAISMMETLSDLPMMFEKQVNQIDDPETIAFIEQELESSKKVNIFEMIFKHAIVDFKNEPNEINTFLVYMYFKNSRSIPGFPIILSEICLYLNKADLHSNTGYKLIKSFLNKYPQTFSKEDMEKLLQLSNSQAWDTILELIEEHENKYFDRTAMQYIYQFCIQNPTDNVSFVKVFYYATIFNGINDGTIKKDATKSISFFTPVSLNAHFNDEMKTIISDSDSFSKPVRDAAMKCLIQFWNNSNDEVYTIIVQSLFKEMIQDPNSRLMSLQLLSEMNKKRNIKSINCGYCRHIEHRIYQPKFLKLNIHSRVEYISFKENNDFNIIAQKIIATFGFTGRNAEITNDKHVLIKGDTIFKNSGIRSGDQVYVRLIESRGKEAILTPPLILSQSTKLKAVTNIIDLIESGECSDLEVQMLNSLLNDIPSDTQIMKMIKEDVSKFVELLRESSGLRFKYLLDCFIPHSYYPNIIHEFVIYGGIPLIKESIMDSTDSELLLSATIILQNCSIVSEFDEYQEELIPLLFSKVTLPFSANHILQSLCNHYNKEIIYNYIENNEEEVIKIISSISNLNDMIPIFQRSYPKLTDALVPHLSESDPGYSNCAIIFAKLCEFLQNNKIGLYFNSCITIMKDMPQISDQISKSLANIIGQFQSAEIGLYVRDLLEICNDKRFASARNTLYEKFTRIKCDSTIEKEIAEYINSLTKELICDRYKYNPMANKRTRYGVGLKNLGATCYLNSTLQMAHSISEFTNTIVQEKFDSESMQNLQKLIAALELTSKKYFEPDPFVYSFRMYGSIQIAVNEQQDASEFWTSLLDQLPESIQNLFCIQMVSVINGISSDFHKEMIDKSPLLGVTVQGCKTLYESLDRILEKETFTGDNKYKSEEFGKIEAYRLNRIRSAPPILWIHLKRFDFNVEQCRYEKVNSRLEFPLDQLDIAKYMEDPPDHLIYDFHGAIIYRGDGIGGHYICIVKTKDGYVKFDDTEATSISKDDFIKLAYGEVKKGTTRDSAYILVYRMKSENETKFENICPQSILKEIDVENSRLDIEVNLFNEAMCHLATRFCGFEQYLEYVIRVFCHSDMKEVNLVENKLKEHIKQIDNMDIVFDIVMKHFSEICEIIVDCPEKQLSNIIISLLKTIIKGISIAQVPKLIMGFAEKLKKNINYNKAIDDFGMLIYECMSVNNGSVGKRVTNLDNFGLLEVLYDVMIYFFNDSTKPLRLESLNMTYLFKIIKLMASHKFKPEYNQFMMFSEYVSKNPAHLTAYKEMQDEITKSRQTIPITSLIDSAKSQTEIDTMIGECNDDKINSLLKKLIEDFEINPSVNYPRITKGARMLIIRPLTDQPKAAPNALKLVATAIPSSKVLTNYFHDVKYSSEMTDEMTSLVCTLKSLMIQAIKDKEPHNSLATQRPFYLLFKALFLDFPEFCKDDIRLIDVLRYIDYIKDQTSLKGYIADVTSVLPTFQDEITVMDVMKYKNYNNSAYPIIQQMFMVMFNAASHDVRLEAIKRSEVRNYVQVVRHCNLGNSPNVVPFIHNLMDLWEIDRCEEAGNCFCDFYVGNSYSNDYLNQTVHDYLRGFRLDPNRLKSRYMRFIAEACERKREDDLLMLLKEMNKCPDPPQITHQVLDSAGRDFMTDETLKQYKILILRSMSSGQTITVDRIKRMSYKRLSSLMCLYYISVGKKKEFMDTFAEKMNYSDTLQSLMDSDFPQLPSEWIEEVAHFLQKVTTLNTVMKEFWRKILCEIDSNTKKEVLGEFVRYRLKSFDDKNSISSCCLLHELNTFSKEEVIDAVDEYCDGNKSNLHDLIEQCFSGK